MKRKTQKQLVLEHLIKHGSIDPKTSYRLYGAYRLGAIIFLLRKEGYNIITENVTDQRSAITGNYTNFAKYILLDDSRPQPSV